ncbi:hypothetical protein AMECASPLE_029236 [Ameca splendens]|uniref:Uncharacterized protein n=1 Tax=Ameca splendens TaxID=208324 RepID=A0ABV0XUS8_9TELE
MRHTTTYRQDDMTLCSGLFYLPSYLILLKPQSVPFDSPEAAEQAPAFHQPSVHLQLMMQLDIFFPGCHCVSAHNKGAYGCVVHHHSALRDGEGFHPYLRPDNKK